MSNHRNLRLNNNGKLPRPAAPGPAPQVVLDPKLPVILTALQQLYHTVYVDESARRSAADEVIAAVSGQFNRIIDQMRDNPRFSGAVIDGSLERNRQGLLAAIRDLATQIAGLADRPIIRTPNGSEGPEPE